jgi:AbrB family looped-hinge helix DNA binding protein
MEFTQHQQTPTQRRVGDYIGTVSTQGRVTLPEEVRKLLRVNPQDKIVFRVTEDAIEISGRLPTLEELAGSFTPLQPAREIEEVIHEAKNEHYARRVTSKLQP